MTKQTNIDNGSSLFLDGARALSWLRHEIEKGAVAVEEGEREGSWREQREGS